MPNANSIWALRDAWHRFNNIQPTTWRVLSIEEQEGLLYTISAVAYNASKFAFVEDGEPLQTRDTTNLNIIPKPPEGLKVLEQIPPGGTVPKQQGAVRLKRQGSHQDHVAMARPNWSNY